MRNLPLRMHAAVRPARTVHAHLLPGKKLQGMLQLPLYGLHGKVLGLNLPAHVACAHIGYHKP